MDKLTSFLKHVVPFTVAAIVIVMCIRLINYVWPLTHLGAPPQPSQQSVPIPKAKEVAGMQKVRVPMILPSPKLQPTTSASGTPSIPSSPSMPPSATDTPPTILVYPDEVKAKLKLPQSILSDPQEQVIESSTVSASDRPQTVTTVLDTKTGETQSFTKVESYPWVAREDRTSVSIDYGFKYQGGQLVTKPMARLGITYEFLQIKGAHIGLKATADTDHELFAGVGLRYSW